MNYEVLWSARAEEQLARIWVYLKTSAISAAVDEATNVRRSELNAVTRSTTRVDSILERRAAQVGRALAAAQATPGFSVGPIEVGYRFNDDRAPVQVLAVAYKARRQ
jgi:hypothetical protein